MQAQAATRSKVSTPSTPARAHRSRRTLSQRAGALGAGHAVRTFTSSPTLRYSIPAASARAAAVVDLPTPGVPVTRMFGRVRASVDAIATAGVRPRQAGDTAHANLAEHSLATPPCPPPARSRQRPVSPGTPRLLLPRLRRTPGVPRRHPAAVSLPCPRRPRARGGRPRARSRAPFPPPPLPPLPAPRSCSGRVRARAQASPWRVQRQREEAEDHSQGTACALARVAAARGMEVCRGGGRASARARARGARRTNARTRATRPRNPHIPQTTILTPHVDAAIDGARIAIGPLSLSLLIAAAAAGGGRRQRPGCRRARPASSRQPASPRRTQPRQSRIKVPASQSAAGPRPPPNQPTTRAETGRARRGSGRLGRSARPAAAGPRQGSARALGPLGTSKPRRLHPAADLPPNHPHTTHPPTARPRTDRARFGIDRSPSVG